MIYTYRVTAFSTTAGESLPSNEAQVDTGVYLPINLTAVLAGSPVLPAADLRWNDASDNETEFRVYRRVNAGPWVMIEKVASTTTVAVGGVKTWLDEGLERDTTYTYRVTAFSVADGESLPSNEALVNTGVFLPINLTAELDASSVVPAADLAWNDASDNETEFNVYRRTGAGPAWVLVATVPSTTTAGIGGEKTYKDTGLDDAMIYTYRVTASNASDDESIPSNEAMVDTGAYLPIVLTAVLDGFPVVPAADLTWNDATDNETEFRVYRRDGAGPAFVQVATVPTTGSGSVGGVMTWQDPSLDRMQVYTYRVTAFSAAIGESFPSNEAMVDTGLFAPIELTGELSGSVATPGTDLSWTDVSDNETEFRVYRRDGDAAAFVLIATVPSDDVSGTGGEVTYNDPILDYLTTFTYRVTAVSAAGGESAPSNEVLVSTTYGPPVRWLDVHLGRRRSLIKDAKRPGADRIKVTGSYVVMDIDSEVPTVIHDADPRTLGITIQARAPGNLTMLVIPANDPRWRASKRGLYRLTAKDVAGGPVSKVRIDTRKSEITWTSRRIDFGSQPSNPITISLSSQGATGSELLTWARKDVSGGLTRAKYVLKR